MTKSNMYPDRKYGWPCFAGCNIGCGYCKPSFQAQLKRWTKPRIDKNGEKQGCELCYKYIPHVHKERLENKYIEKHFPKETKGDEFIWVGQNGDISFIRPVYMERIFEIINQYPELNFFFQTKNPHWYQQWDFPENVILGITLESNIYYPEISKAVKPWKRAADFYFICHKKKRVTIEPIMEFQHSKFFAWLRDINPEICYVGYNSKDSKNCHLPEPSLAKTELFISDLRKITKAKEKLMRKAWDEK